MTDSSEQQPKTEAELSADFLDQAYGDQALATLYEQKYWISQSLNMMGGAAAGTYTENDIAEADRILKVIDDGISAREIELGFVEPPQE